MPRKRARNVLKRPVVEHDIAPGEVEKKSGNQKRREKINNKRAKEYTTDGSIIDNDTPKSFQRLMRWSDKKQGKISEDDKARNKRDSEDRGRSKVKSQKSHKKNTIEASELKIQPGESMRDFSRRVDQALPMVKARAGSPTRIDKRKQKKLARVAKEEEARQERMGCTVSEDEELARIEQEEEDFEKYGTKINLNPPTKKNKNGKREASPDPWAVLSKPAPKFGDVVSAPPTLNFKPKKYNNVPKTVGVSMAKRAMLEEERNRFIDMYREMMDKKQKPDQEED
ncbi:hypothetical protein NADFUDRAFT_49180 [Nadsonia fulvescens var. elongata DSM 6958]|uniref:Uncharacterized protein n=1 Tax=Nadsonia fulvescens var. elongata DSM 6958 TaxID=857566 RepID=A0A1E3PSY7_9ASCO|nr:hypothetical protein NADFUDRAFT_49180 [Nadsonia fulvescens var. elongata DSM 6958]